MLRNIVTTWWGVLKFYRLMIYEVKFILLLSLAVRSRNTKIPLPLTCVGN